MSNGSHLQEPELLIVHEPVVEKTMPLTQREMNLIHYLRREIHGPKVIELMTDGAGEVVMILSIVDALRHRL